jgi:hypothetical protein
VSGVTRSPPADSRYHGKRSGAIVPATCLGWLGAQLIAMTEQDCGERTRFGKSAPLRIFLVKRPF